MRTPILTGYLAAIFVVSNAWAGNWGQFRGPQGNGISDETNIPTKWDEKTNVKWKVPLPGPGNSSPMVWDDKVYVTCAPEGTADRGVYCFDRQTGNLLWQKLVQGDTPTELTHSTNPYCGSSPAVDADGVVVWQGGAGLIAYDHAGREMWHTDLGPFRHIWGYGSSPVIFYDKIILNFGPGKRSFLAAYDRKTGKEQWISEQPGGDDGVEETNGKANWTGSWSTPLLVQVNAHPQILVSMPHQVQAHDPKDGKLLWYCKGLTDLVYTSVVAGPEAGFAMSGYTGDAIGFKLGGEGDVTASNRLWEGPGPNPQRIGSGVVVGNDAYIVNENGVAACFDPISGQEKWKDRLCENSVWGSVIAVESRLYVTDQGGITYVFAARPDKLELISKNPLGDTSNSTPAFSNGQVFVRTYQHLWCIAESTR